MKSAGKCEARRSLANIGPGWTVFLPGLPIPVAISVIFKNIRFHHAVIAWSRTNDSRLNDSGRGWSGSKIFVRMRQFALPPPNVLLTRRTHPSGVE
jgi:hypothetical protein